MAGRTYRDLYNLFKDNPTEGLEQLRRKAYSEGYGEFHRLNKRYFEYLWKRSEEEENGTNLNH